MVLQVDRRELLLVEGHQGLLGRSGFHTGQQLLAVNVHARGAVAEQLCLRELVRRLAREPVDETLDVAAARPETGPH